MGSSLLLLGECWAIRRRIVLGGEFALSLSSHIMNDRTPCRKLLRHGVFRRFSAGLLGGLFVRLWTSTACRTALAAPLLSAKTPALVTVLHLEIAANHRFELRTLFGGQ